MLLGYYQGKTAADLQSQLHGHRLIAATTLYEVTVPAGPEDVDLADAKSAAGPRRSRASRRRGICAMAVMCSKCQVPAPVVMSILQPQ